MPTVRLTVLPIAAERADGADLVGKLGDHVPGIIFACLYFNVSAAEEVTAESESAMTEMAERSFMVMM